MQRRDRSKNSKRRKMRNSMGEKQTRKKSTFNNQAEQFQSCKRSENVADEPVQFTGDKIV
jgi:hypothetical protein